jgi:hypothetical protein
MGTAYRYGTQDWTNIADIVTAPTGAVMVRYCLLVEADTDETGGAWFDSTSIMINRN